MITVRHLGLPAGLSALALPDHDGNLTLFLSDAISPGQQRAAVRAALGASRQAGWRAAMLPVLTAILAFRGRRLLRVLASACRAHTVLTATCAATAATIAAVTTLIALAPNYGLPVISFGNTGSGQTHVVAPGSPDSPPHHGGTSHPRATRHSRQAGHQAKATRSTAPGPAQPTASPTRTGHTPTPYPSATRTSQPVPTPSPSASATPTPTPTPTPSPTPTPTSTCHGSGNGGGECGGNGGGGNGGGGNGNGGGNGDGCIWLLGVKVCS